MKRYEAIINITIKSNYDNKKAEALLEKFFDKLEEIQAKEIDWYIDYYSEVEKDELR
jgi:hypothetical protein